MVTLEVRTRNPHAQILVNGTKLGEGRAATSVRKGATVVVEVRARGFRSFQQELTVERSGANYVARVQDGDPINRHKPSVEALFLSAAKVVGPNAIGIMLTGMGADGARAMKVMKDAGAYNYCQDEASCVVFGMPREAIAAGAADEVLPLNQIATKVLERLRATSGISLNRV